MRLINYDAVVFHRVGGLDLTTRFRGQGLPIINESDWKIESSTVEIAFSSGTALQSAILVREFIPRYGDVTGRRYTDAQGNHHWVNLPSYGLTDPAAYLDLIRTQIPKQSLSWAATQSRAHQEALRLINNNTAPELETLLQYDFGRFQKTRSAYITGPTRLGIEALPSDTAAMPDQAPLPRMITAQCDIVLTGFLAELLSELFGSAGGLLLKRLALANATNTHVAYVALRILVEGTIWVLVDKERRDEQNNINDRTLQVELQDNLNSVIYTFSNSRQGMDCAGFESSLSAEAAAFYKDLQNDDGATTSSPAWKGPVFWLPSVSELVTDLYEAKEVFKLE